MTSTAPFDPAELPMESEAATRARAGGVEWGAVQARSVTHADYRLAPDFEPYTPSHGRLDRFDAEYAELPVHVTGFDSGVLYGQEFLVCDAAHPTVSSERLYLTRHQRKLRRLDLERLSVPHGPTFLVGANAGHENFYHWNFQCLPGIALLKRTAVERGLDYRIVVPPMDASRRRCLELAGVDASECVTLRPDQFIAGVPMLYTSATCGYHALQPSARVIALLDGYRDTCVRTSRARLPTRFYVSRRDAPGKREVRNESELVEVLRRRGHAELVMSSLRVEDQVAAFAGAESVVAPHGAGLVNLMFAPSTATLLEILPENYRMAYFFRLAQVRGMRYSQVLSRVVEGWEGSDVHECPVTVDVDAVLNALDEPARDVRPKAA